jgi:hypothetical protein
MLGYGPISADPVSALLDQQGAAADTLVARVPLIAPTPRARQQGFVQVAQNLLLTTLAVGAVAAPFVPDELQNPVRRVAQIQQTVHQNLLTTTLAQPAAVPFKPVTFANPLPAKRSTQVEQRPVAPGSLLAPFSPDDLSIYVARKVPQQPELQTGLLQTSLYTDPPTLVARVPLVAAAVKRAIVQQPDPLHNLLATTLGAQAPVAAPFRQTDWPNPQRRAGNMGAQVLTVLSYYDQNAFRQTEWPNSVVARKVQQPQLVPNLSTSTLSVVVPAGDPRRQTDWPNPVRAKQVQQPQPQTGLLQTALFTTPIDPKVSQTDWPNPTRARAVQQPDVPPALLQGALFTEPPTLVARAPVAAQKPVAAVPQQPAVLPNLATTLLYTPPVVNPIVPPVWDNPVRRIDTMGSQAYESVSYYSETPFRQSDWPNPVLPKRVQQPEHQVGRWQTYGFVAPQPLPFNKSDWLNPQPIKPVPDRWNTSQGQNPEFIPPAVVVVVPPPLGGDDKPDARKYPGWDRKRSELKRSQELRQADEIRALYRKLQGIPEAAPRVAEISTALRAQQSVEQGDEFVSLAKRVASLDTAAIELELALRLLAAEIERQADEEDELAMALILALI